MMTNQILILGDITQLLVALIIIILSIVGSLIQSRQEALKRERQKRARPPAVPPRDEIDVLLQEAMAKPPQSAGGFEPEVASAPLGAPGSGPRRAPQRKPPKRLPEPEVGEVIPATLAESRAEESIAEHVAHTFQTAGPPRELGTQASRPQLKPRREVRPAVERGPMSPQPPKVPEVPEITSPPIAEPIEAPFHPLSQVLLNTFSTPEGMATAIILKDVLERPEWRWRRQ